MSITSALSNALSGLTANARAAGVVSTNLANIQTDGYGRREVDLSHDRHGVGGGVRVIGITRHVDAGVLSDRRLADSALAHSETRAEFLQQVQASVGTPDQPGSLSARIDALEAALVTAASRPDAANRLQEVAQRAGEVAQGFNTVSGEIGAKRTRAEAQIMLAVNGLNVDLGQVREINIQIQDAQRRGIDASGLQDHRQLVIDRIAVLIPVREVPRDNGAVALMTPGGALLVDGPSAVLEFTRSNVVAPHMTLENGLLSGLTINGEEVAPAGMRSPVSGGRLSALFEVRDTLAIDMQRQIDALARDIVDRFQTPTLDPTRAATDPGLFTNAGSAFAPADETGLAGRIALNTKVDLAVGGKAWKLRDGLGATAPGPTGDATLLNALGEVLSGRSMMVSGDLDSGSGSAQQHLSAMVSQLAQGALAEDRTTSFAAVRQSGLQERLLSDGVNSDEETAHLLLIEQSYSANARMIRTLDEMMQTLLRI
jgi:flagellar hook-associated protein 1 FlgK